MMVIKHNENTIMENFEKEINSLFFRSRIDWVDSEFPEELTVKPKSMGEMRAVQILANRGFGNVIDACHLRWGGSRPPVAILYQGEMRMAPFGLWALESKDEICFGEFYPNDWKIVGDSHPWWEFDIVERGNIYILSVNEK